MYKKIKPSEAKMLIDEGKAIVVDVREPEELLEGYIDGSVLVPLTNFELNAKNMLKDKNALYLLYCRSGRRSAIAAKKLLTMGYTNVIDFGGIIDWPFETVM